MNLVVKGARLSFPHLFKAKAFQEGQEAKFSAALILDKEKDAQTIKDVKFAIDTVVKEAFKGNPKGVKICLRDGAEKELDGYGPTVMFFNASSGKRVPVVDRNKSPLAEEDGKIYAGCYVNVSVRFWAQDNKFGKRINCALRAVQFLRDGPAFGEAPVDTDKEFEALPDSDDLPDDDMLK